MPLFGLLLLVIPYLPWLPDQVPALQILAGPARVVVWLVVAAQLVWVLWQQRFVTADWLQRATLRSAGDRHHDSHCAARRRGVDALRRR